MHGVIMYISKRMAAEHAVEVDVVKKHVDK